MFTAVAAVWCDVYPACSLRLLQLELLYKQQLLPSEAHSSQLTNVLAVLGGYTIGDVSTMSVLECTAHLCHYFNALCICECGNTVILFSIYCCLESTTIIMCDAFSCFESVGA